MAAYAALFTGLSLRRWWWFWAGGTDLAVYDHLTWRLAHGYSAYHTMDQMHFWGDHLSWILYLVAPLYWLYSGPATLLAVQSMALGAGALPLFLLARRWCNSEEFAGGDVAAALLAASYLLYLPLHQLNLIDFHPECFVPALLLATIYFLETDRLAPAVLCAALAMLCKETMGLTAAAVGLAAVLAGRRRGGGIVIALSLVWMLLAIWILMPAFRGGLPFRQELFFRSLGGSPTRALLTLLARPGFLADRLTESQSVLYLSQLLLPLMFLPLFSPRWLVAALPALALNLLSDWTPTRMIIFQYHMPVLAGLWVAAAASLAGAARAVALLVARRPTLRGQPWQAIVSWGLAGLLLLLNASLVVAALGTYPTDRFTSRPDLRHRAALRAAVNAVPPNVPVSASYALLPHLGNRRHLLWFPAPFLRFDWKTSSDIMWPLEPFDRATFEQRLRDASVQYVAFDTRGFADASRTNGPFDAPFGDRQIRDAAWESVDRSRNYQRIFEQDGVRVYRRRTHRPREHDR